MGGPRKFKCPFCSGSEFHDPECSMQFLSKEDAEAAGESEAYEKTKDWTYGKPARKKRESKKSTPLIEPVLSAEHKFYQREDGLHHCSVCNGAEASLTTHCPNKPMTEEIENFVSAGMLDYVERKWIITRMDPPGGSIHGSFVEETLIKIIAEQEVAVTEKEYRLYANPNSPQDVQTPPEFLEAVRAYRLGGGNFSYDLAAKEPNVCEIFFTKEQDSLNPEFPWHEMFDETTPPAWLNPEFKRSNEFLDRCGKEAELGAKVMSLVQCAAGCSYWHRLVFGHPCAQLIFLEGRINFVGYGGGAKIDCALIEWSPENRNLPDDLRVLVWDWRTKGAKPKPAWNIGAKFYPLVPVTEGDPGYKSTVGITVFVCEKDGKGLFCCAQLSDFCTCTGPLRDGKNMSDEEFAIMQQRQENLEKKP
jgi:hypothetical protein